VNVELRPMVLDDVDPVAAIAAQTPAQGWSAAEIAREVRETPAPVTWLPSMPRMAASWASPACGWWSISLT